MKSMLFRVFVGAVAGLLVWVIMEPSAPKDLASATWPQWEALFVGMLGVFIGAGIGGSNGFLAGGKTHTLRGLLFGGGFGLVGIVIGSRIGMVLAYGVAGPEFAFSGNFVQVIIGRVLALTPMGAMLGLAIGASTLSPKRAVHGLIGGLIAGAIGGATFDLVGHLVGQGIVATGAVAAGQDFEVGGLSRALYAIMLGAGIALFISLVENLAKSAWVRMRLGRNEGREWPLYSPTTTIGRSENATIPIFGDPAVQPFHATIFKHERGYYVADNGGGVLLNGQPVSQAPLVSGAMLQLGQTQLEFLMREGAAPVRGRDLAGSGAYPMGHAPQPPAPGQPTPAPQQTVQPQMASTPTTVISPAAPALVALDGPLAGQRFPIAQATELGRECASIPLTFDSGVSRRHANISPAASGVAVVDLGSTNGVFVNGQRVQSANVPLGGTLKIGMTTFRVE